MRSENDSRPAPAVGEMVPSEEIWRDVEPARAEEDDIVIVTRGLTKEFESVPVVHDVTMEIPRGKILGFIGPSGSGKTTTVRLLTGIYTPTRGEARVFGSDPNKFSREERERIGYMPQLFVLYPNLSVRENMNFAASLYGVGWRARKKIMGELLDLVELTGHEHKLARDISGGMQRRLSLAATLIHRPELLFLDEPTAAVDPVLRRKFWDYFKELQERNYTLFITTQYVGEAANCDYVAVMAEGRLITMKTPEDLRRGATGGDVINVTLAQAWRYEHLFQLQAEPYIKRRVEFVSDRVIRVVVDDASSTIPILIDWCEESGLKVESIREYLPSFDDVFVQLVQEEKGNA